MIGTKINKLTVIEYAPPDKYGRKRYKCLCDCGNTVNVFEQGLKTGRSKHCLKCKSTKHGLHKHPLYGLLCCMKYRCNNIKSKDYAVYGKRGIRVCKEWSDNPTAFIEWGINNGYKKELQIDRIENDGNYEPSNCRFVTSQINNQNQSTTKLNIDDVKSIKFALENGIKGCKLASLYHVSKTTISSIKNNNSWGNV